VQPNLREDHGQEDVHTLLKLLSLLLDTRMSHVAGRTIFSRDLGLGYKKDRVLVVASMKNMYPYMFSQVRQQTHVAFRCGYLCASVTSLPHLSPLCFGVVCFAKVKCPTCNVHSFTSCLVSAQYL
jgi:hypothetical protein